MDSSEPRSMSAHESRTGDAERRVAPRFPIKQAVTVRFSSSGSYEFTGVSRDMSSSGMFLYAESQVAVGEDVEMLLTLPSGNSEPIPMRVRGRVVRVEKNPPTGLAVEFVCLVIAPEPLKRI